MVEELEEVAGITGITHKGVDVKGGGVGFATLQDSD